MLTEYACCYKSAVENGHELDCFLGVEDEYRFNDSRYSFFVSITDMHVLWNRCLFPLYEDGDHDLPQRIMDILRKLLERADALSIYQLLSCIDDYESIERTSKIPLPFTMDFSCLADGICQTIKDHKKELIHCTDEKIYLNHQSVYITIKSIIKNTNSLKHIYNLC